MNLIENEKFMFPLTAVITFENHFYNLEFRFPRGADTSSVMETLIAHTVQAETAQKIHTGKKGLPHYGLSWPYQTEDQYKSLRKINGKELAVFFGFDSGLFAMRLDMLRMFEQSKAQADQVFTELVESGKLEDILKGGGPMPFTPNTFQGGPGAK
jgi:hypothetical protein